MRYNELTFQGRNAVLEAFRSGKTIDKLFILDGCQDGPIKSIVREAKMQLSIMLIRKDSTDLQEQGIIRGLLPLVQLMNMQRLMIYLHQLRKREKIHLYSFLMR